MKAKMLYNVDSVIDEEGVFRGFDRSWMVSAQMTKDEAESLLEELDLLVQEFGSCYSMLFEMREKLLKLKEEDYGL